MLRTLLLSLYAATTLGGTPHDQTVLSLFREISTLSRPSFKEEQVRAFATDLADKAHAAHAADAAGNLLITLPGSGRYAGLTQPVVALQAHMDMVFAVADAPAGANLDPYFAHGVKVVEEDGWLHSEGYKTTLGADDGVGLSMALRYLVDVQEEHPPLEILLTTAEEQGLVGAKNLALPVKAPVLINIDGSIPETFIFGCLGSLRGIGRGELAAAPAAAERAYVTLTVAGLKGGHSGHDINLLRLNAIREGLSLVARLADAGYADLQLAAAKGGLESTMNAIPSAFEMTLALPTADVAGVTALATSLFKADLQAATDDDQTATVTVAPAAAGAPALSSEATQAFVRGLGSLRNGVLTLTPSSPNGVNTSSNFGWILLQPNAAGTSLAFTAGFMIRSYDQAEINSFGSENTRILEALAPGAAVEKKPPTPPWRADTNSPFYTLAKRLLPKFAYSLSSGGLEAAVLGDKFPGLDIVAMGTHVVDEHSPTERLELATVAPTNAAVETLVTGLGDAALGQ